MLRDAEAALLTRRFQQMLERHAARVAVATGRVWSGLGAWNEADVAVFAERTLRLHVAAKSAAVQLTSAYLSTLAETAVVGVPVDVVPALVPDPREPFTALWRTLKGGGSLDDGVVAGRSAAEGRARTQVFRASRQTGDQWAARSGQQVVGWRRVLTGTSCEWCALVSTQRYRTSESADFGHTHCDCATIPIIGDADPGRFLLGDVYENVQAGRVSERIDENRRASEGLQRAENAALRRDDALAQARRETVSERRQRLTERARKWDDKAASYRARAATEATRTAVPPQTGRTGYVDPNGRPAARPAA